jgi:pimeloyl-ACP methyl ester carboxylesterase
VFSALATLHHDGMSIHYTTRGSRSSLSAIAFLSGAGSDSTLWREQVSYLENRFFILTIDHQGVGKSDLPTGPCSADQLAADVKAILDVEGIESINLVGFSLGGLVAQRFVNNYPGSVERLVLMNCSLGAGNPDTVLPRPDVINMFLYFAALTREDLCRNAADYNFGSSFERDDPEGYRAFFDYTMKNNLAIAEHIPILVSDKAFIDDLSSVRIPVMVILSKDDPVAPPGNGAAFQRHWPHARIEYLDGHHASMLLHPREVNELLESFLG